MSLEIQISEKLNTYLSEKYSLPSISYEFQTTRKEFEGDLTLVVFPLLKFIKSDPVALGEEVGLFLVNSISFVESFNVVKGFLNLSFSEAYFLDVFKTIYTTTNFGIAPSVEECIMVEYSSPNTNKPLHLGHVRNNLLGFSVAEILKASGKKVYKTQIINDRGIHICKSMLAWQKYGNGETPTSTGLKGDKLVGNYYVKFEQVYKEEILRLVNEGFTENEAKTKSPLLIEAQEMLRKWELGDQAVVTLWKKMNQWVYDGFEETYQRMGVDFDKIYYESQTYLLGKDVIADGLSKGVFFQKQDGSVWIDLTEDGLDEKLVLRSDGTSVYITQDIGTAIQRAIDFHVNGMVYTVGNEQDYHFKVLFLILQKLGYDWAEKMYHLSYGMVDLPSGKMKSREGTVVDADDLMEEMKSTAKKISQELGKLDGLSSKEKETLYETIGLGALKYHILKVDPKKRILFNPEESVDFQGNTGPFIQYAYARIQSILRKSAVFELSTLHTYTFEPKEKSVIKQLQLFPTVIKQAANNYSPALVCNYVFDLVKEFNSFYQNVSILGAESETQIGVRVCLVSKVAEVIKNSMSLLGINVPDRM